MVVVAGECYGSWGPYQSAIDALGLGDRVMVHNEFIEDRLVHICTSGAADHVVLPYKAASTSGVTALPSIATCQSSLWTWATWRRPWCQN